MAAGHAARHSTHSTHSIDRRLYESGQVSLKDRCSLACMGLHKAAWGQVVLRYICVLVCCCKRLDACANTACQGVCINVETLLKSFLSIYSIISLSLYSSSLSAIRIRRAIFHCCSLATCGCPCSHPAPCWAILAGEPAQWPEAPKLQWAIAGGRRGEGRVVESPPRPHQLRPAVA